MTGLQMDCLGRSLLSFGLAAMIGATTVLIGAPAQAQRASLNDVDAKLDQLLDERPTPLTSCGVISQPGSYLVTRNLTAAGSCLGILADNVTIDLGGFILSGNGASDGILTDNSPHKDITVRNGTVTGFNRGIDLSQVEGAKVENVRIRDNASFGVLVGASSVVANSVIRHNGSDGVRVLSGSTVTGNTISENSGEGILAAEGGTITGNTVADNTGHGIDAGFGSVVRGNAVSGSGGTGIRAFASAVNHNAVSDNGTIGIFLGNGSSAIGNTVANNDSHGLSGGAGIVVKDNSALGNGGTGIIAGSGSTVSQNSVLNNSPVGIQAVCPSNVLGNTSINNSDNLFLVGAGCNAVDNLAP